MPIQRQVRKRAGGRVPFKIEMVSMVICAFEVTVSNMKMGWLVIAVVHRDDNAKETGNFGHDFISISILQRIVF